MNDKTPLEEMQVRNDARMREIARMHRTLEAEVDYPAADQLLAAALKGGYVEPQVLKRNVTETIDRVLSVRRYIRDRLQEAGDLSLADLERAVDATLAATLPVIDLEGRS